MKTTCPHSQAEIEIEIDSTTLRKVELSKVVASAVVRSKPFSLTSTSLFRIFALFTMAFAAPVASAVTALNDALNSSKPISSLTFTPATKAVFLPGKGQGIPTSGEKAGQLGIALTFAQNNYWVDNRWSAQGYNVKTGTLSDVEKRLPSVNAFEVFKPILSSDFSFFASGSDLFFEFPTVDDWTVYSVIGKSFTPPTGKPTVSFKNHLVIEEARIPRSDVTVGGFTKVPGTNLHTLTHPKIFFFLPSSVVVRSDSTVAAGVAASRIAETRLGRITKLKIDVSQFGIPENSATSGRKPGDPFGAKPGLTCFPEADGGISVVWQASSNNQLFLTRVGANLRHNTVPLPRSLGRCSNAVRDSKRNIYYVTYAAGTNPQVMLVKVAPDGREFAAHYQNTAPTGLNIAGMSDYWDSVRLSCAGDRLCVTYGRGMDNGHQGSIIVTYAASDLSLIRNHGQNSSHSFDSRIVPDGSDFINLSLGDNYPRGLALSKVRPTSAAGRVIFTYKTRHNADGLASNDNRTYTEIGDITATTEGYGVIFTSEAGTDNSKATGAINEARNVGFLLVSRNFDSIPQSEIIVPPSMILTTGADSPLFGFYNFGGGYVRQQYRGVRWLTRYTNLETANATRPKMLIMPDGKRLILWEKWTPSRHVSTHGMRIDALGNIQTTTADLGSLRLSDGDSAVLAGHRVHLVTGNGKELEWSIIETNKPLNLSSNDNFASPLVLSGLPVESSGSNVGNTFEANEPRPMASMGASAWFRWTAPRSGTVHIDTNGSDFDTVLAVWEGDDLSNLNQIALDNDGGVGSASKLSIAAVAGVTYQIAVYGNRGSRGSIALKLTPQPSRIAGRITDSDGNPLAGIFVSAYRFYPGEVHPFDPAYWEKISSTRTNANGYYLIGGLSPDTYRVGFNDQEQNVDYDMEFYENASSVELANDIVVAAETTVTGIHASLARSPEGVQNADVLSDGKVGQSILPTSFADPVVKTYPPRSSMQPEEILRTNSLDATIEHSSEGKFTIISYERPVDYLDQGLNYKLLVSSNLDAGWTEVEPKLTTVTRLGGGMEKVEYVLPWTEQGLYFKLEEVSITRQMEKAVGY